MTESIPWVDGLTIGQALRQTAQRCGTSDALVCPHAGVRMTWAEFDVAVDGIARGLLALGFQKGDHLGVWSTNWPEWVILQFATARIGVVLVTVNPAYRPAELEYVLTQSEVRGLALIEVFKKSQFFQMLDEVCPELATTEPGKLHGTKFPKLQWVIRLRGSEHPGMLSWQQLADAGQQVVDVFTEG